MPEETVGTTETIDCECGPCRKRKGLSHNVRSGIIHDYSSVPRSGWRVRRTAAETAAGTVAPTFGVELETSAPRFRLTDLPDRPYVPPRPYTMDPAELAEYDALRHRFEQWAARNRRHQERQQRRFAEAGNMTADEAVSVAQPVGLWHPKHDGSVSGPEFASQPCTMAYWRAHRPAVASMFKALLHGGMRSHDGDTAGLHVNIGSDAFGDGSGSGDVASQHLKRFCQLVAVNPRFSTRMSQRTHSSASSWANMSDIGTPHRLERFIEEWRQYGQAGTGHSSAVNLAHVGRVEFRMPRGTLRVDRFYAKLEWTASMVEYTRDADNALNVASYVAWVQARASEWPELVTYMKDRFAARFENAEVSA